MPDKNGAHPAPGFDHIDTWVFDLDNTLYPAASHLFPQIQHRMNSYIVEHLKMPMEDAFVLRRRYYLQYGTTLRGLMLNHDIKPEGFLDYVHDIDHSVLAINPLLDAALGRLPGRKIIYTNGSERHAVKVLDRLGISRHFESIYDICASDYIPKPDPAAYDGLVARHNIAPAKSIMFEDIHINLKPAAALGMATGWVHHGEKPAKPDEDLSHCMYVTDDLVGWLDKAVPKRP